MYTFDVAPVNKDILLFFRTYFCFLYRCINCFEAFQMQECCTLVCFQVIFYSQQHNLIRSELPNRMVKVDMLCSQTRRCRDASQHSLDKPCSISTSHQVLQHTVTSPCEHFRRVSKYALVYRSAFSNIT